MRMAMLPLIDTAKQSIARPIAIIDMERRSMPFIAAIVIIAEICSYGLTYCPQM